MLAKIALFSCLLVSPAFIQAAPSILHQTHPFAAPTTLTPACATGRAPTLTLSTTNAASTVIRIGGTQTTPPPAGCESTAIAFPGGAEPTEDEFQPADGVLCGGTAEGTITTWNVEVTELITYNNPQGISVQRPVKSSVVVTCELGLVEPEPEETDPNVRPVEEPAASDEQNIAFILRKVGSVDTQAEGRWEFELTPAVPADLAGLNFRITSCFAAPNVPDTLLRYDIIGKNPSCILDSDGTNVLATDTLVHKIEIYPLTFSTAPQADVTLTCAVQLCEEEGCGAVSACAVPEPEGRRVRKIGRPIISRRKTRSVPQTFSASVKA